MLSTKGRNGQIQKQISVNSDDPNTPRLVLTLKGEIVVDVTFDPGFLSFDRVGKNEKASKEFSLHVNEPDKIKVSSVAIGNEDFDIERISGSADGDAKYKVTFKGSDKIGSIATSVQFGITGSDAVKAELPIRIAVMSNLEYRKGIYFRKTEGVFKPQEITFRSRSGKPIEIKGVEDPDRLLKLKVVKSKGIEASISAEVIETTVREERSSGHKLLVKTNDPDEPVAEIVYSVFQKSLERPNFKNPGSLPLKPQP